MIQRLITYLILLTLPYSGRCQEWFPVGATWHYNQIIFFMGESYVRLQVTGDTIIQGIPCRIIEGSGVCGLNGDDPNFLYEEGDKVYWYNAETEQFSVLYDFTLEPGDTLSYHLPFIDDTYYVLDSITYWEAGGETLRIQHFTWIEGLAYIGDKVYERLGSSIFLYPLHGVCDPHTGPLRCYQDSIIDLQMFIDPDLSCDYVYFTMGSSDLARPELSVFPNPAKGWVTVEAQDIIREIEWIALPSGISVKTMLCMSSHCRAEINELIAGIYILRMTLEDGRVVMKKMIILN